MPGGALDRLLARFREKNRALTKRAFPHTEGDPRTAYRALVDRHFEPGDTVVDLGAGDQNALDLWLPPAKGGDLPKARLISLDVDRDGLARNDSPNRVLGVGHDIPLPDGSVHLVISRYVFEHVREPARLLEEVHRVLRPGGALVFLAPHAFYYVSLGARATPLAVHERVRYLLGAEPEETHVFPTHYQLNTPWSIEEEANRAGLEIAELTVRAGPPQYTDFLPPPIHWLFIQYHHLLARSPRLRRLAGVSILGALVKPEA